MKREAGIALELLERHDSIDEEKSNICNEIREFTLELLRIICKRFPQECGITYCPIDHARRAMMEKRHTEYDRNNNILLYFLLHLYC
jgi:hypothetical protein